MIPWFQKLACKWVYLFRYIEAAQAQQVKAGENPGALPNLRVSGEVLAQLISTLLDNLSTELENGSLVQLFVPRLDHQTNVVSLVTHKVRGGLCNKPNAVATHIA